MPPLALFIKFGALICFGYEAWKSKSLVALGLALLTLALLF